MRVWTFGRLRSVIFVFVTLVAVVFVSVIVAGPGHCRKVDIAVPTSICDLQTDSLSLRRPKLVGHKENSFP